MNTHFTGHQTYHKQTSSCSESIDFHRIECHRILMSTFLTTPVKRDHVCLKYDKDEDQKPEEITSDTKQIESSYA